MAVAGGWLKKSPAGWLPVYWDQLQAQRSVTSMGEPFAFVIVIHEIHQIWFTSYIFSVTNILAEGWWCSMVKGVVPRCRFQWVKSRLKSTRMFCSPSALLIAHWHLTIVCRITTPWNSLHWNSRVPSLLIWNRISDKISITKIDIVEHPQKVRWKSDGNLSLGLWLSHMPRTTISMEHNALSWVENTPLYTTISRLWRVPREHVAACWVDCQHGVVKTAAWNDQCTGSQLLHPHIHFSRYIDTEPMQ